MEYGLFKKVIDEIADYILLILLWDWGEPFLNPAIYDMIIYAKRKNLKIISSTNGHPFAKEDCANKLVRSGIDSIIFAVDGISQETYQRYRVRGDLETAITGIKRVVAAKRALNSRTPFINFRFIVMRHNEHEVPAVKRFARALGADALTLKTLNPHSDDSYAEKGDSQDTNVSDFIPKNDSFRRFRYENDRRTRIRVKNNPCKNLWNGPSIHWNGTVCPCTYDYNERYSLGDLNKESFKNIWFGSPYRNMRSRFRASWEEIEICGECSYAYEGGSCIDETIAEALFFHQNGA
jgi:radical SAM protein with 4Fe4S-binding SPASM domain